MQGTGTQAEPYIPETWDEFVTTIGTSGANVELPEGGGVFDMDEIDPEGDFSVYIKCASIYGNDWEIQNANNIRFYADQGSSNKIIDKLHFLKFNHTDINAGASFSSERSSIHFMRSGL